MPIKNWAITVLFFFSAKANAQLIKIVSAGTNTSLRGISISGKTVWVSGSNGTVGKSIDGNSWQWLQVAGFEKTDFRDIEAFDNNTAIIMGIASPAYILKTGNGGNSWRIVYKNTNPSMFLDAMDFKNKRKGVVIGDPLNNRFFIAKTKNQGHSWQEETGKHLPQAESGEAFFAASGSNIVLHKNKIYAVSGGTSSRLFIGNKSRQLPIMQGTATSGANAIAINNNIIAIAGGDFTKPDRTDSTFIISANKGKSWYRPDIPPGGYRSSICFISEKNWITCGITGVDISYDSGKTWKNISQTGFNSCAYSKKHRAVYFAGNNGKVGKLIL